MEGRKTNKQQRTEESEKKQQKEHNINEEKNKTKVKDGWKKAKVDKHKTFFFHFRDTKNKTVKKEVNELPLMEEWTGKDHEHLQWKK